MVNALNINSIAEGNRKIDGNIISWAINGKNSLSVSPASTDSKSTKIYDYSAIKLTDTDKYYRMEIKKQSDSLLKAAESITNRFPPLFEQLATSLNNVRNEISIDANSNNSEEPEGNKIPDKPNDRTEPKPIKEEANNTEPSNAEMTIDVDGISSVITNFVDEIAGFYSLANESNSYTAQSTVQQITDTFDSFKDSLSEIGITTDDTSFIEVDQSKLKTAIKSGAAESVLAAENGFTERISKIADRSGKHSDNFIEKTNPNNNSRHARNTNINFNYMTNVSIDN